MKKQGVDNVCPKLLGKGGIHKIINVWAISGRIVNNFTMVLAGVLLLGCSGPGGRLVYSSLFAFIP